MPHPFIHIIGIKTTLPVSDLLHSIQNRRIHMMGCEVYWKSLGTQSVVPLLVASTSPVKNCEVLAPTRPIKSELEVQKDAQLILVHIKI